MIAAIRPSPAPLDGHDDADGYPPLTTFHVSPSPQVVTVVDLVMDRLQVTP